MKLVPYAQLGARALRSRWARLALPFKLTVAVTGRCNAKCTTCHISSGDGVGAVSAELSPDEYDRLFASCGDSLLWLDLTGGEPFIRADLTEICRSALSRCPNLLMLHLPTNGLEPERVEQACRGIAGIRPHRLVVSVSIFGPPALNNRLRRPYVPSASGTAEHGDTARSESAGAFELACETLRRLSAAGIEAYPGLTLCRLNEDTLTDTVSAVLHQVPDFRPSDLHVNLFHNAEAYYGRTADLTPGSESILQALLHRRVTSAFSLAEIAYLSLGLTYLERRKMSGTHGDQVSPIPCSALRGSAYIAPDGALFPCLPWDRPLGCLRDHHMSLPSLWNSAAATAALEAYEGHQCPGCWTPCEAYQALLARPEQVLAALRRFVLQRLWERVSAAKTSRVGVSSATKASGGG